MEGTITDNKTGKPIAGAKIDLRYEYSYQGSLKSSGATVSSDKSGEFSFSAEEKHSGGISITEISKFSHSSGQSVCPMCLIMTAAVQRGIAEGAFQDGARMERLDVIFAKRYITAFQARQAGKTTTLAWKSDGNFPTGL